MSATITAEEALARVERLSKELAQQGADHPQPAAKLPAKLKRPKAH